MAELFDLLNKNLGAITLFVGLIAIFLYSKQKKDLKREVAKLILQEIRYAEKQIKIARERQNVFLLFRELLPTNNWYKNIHLFVNDLEETDRDAISDFYAKVNFLDYSIRGVTDFNIRSMVPIQVSRATQSVPLPTASVTPVSQQDGSTAYRQEVVVQKFQLKAEIMLQEVSDQIEFLYNTPAADKLRELSRKLWYHLS